MALRCRIGWHDFVPGQTCHGDTPIPSRVCLRCRRVESTLYRGTWHLMTHPKPGFQTLYERNAAILRSRSPNPEESKP